MWKDGPYQKETLARTPDQLDDFLEVGLFRREENALGFVHDSLLYYFAGKTALRDYLGPGEPLRDEPLDESWPAATAEAVRDNPPAWERAGEFLGGALSPRELLALAERMLAIEPKPGTEGLAAVLHRVLRGRARLEDGPSSAIARDPADAAIEPILAELERATCARRDVDTRRHWPPWRCNGCATPRWVPSRCVRS